MKEIMKENRAHPFKEIGGLKVVALEDYLLLKRYEENNVQEIRGLPTSDVLKYYLQDGSTVSIRPSGTEPKCKFYYGAVGTSSKQVMEKPKALHKAILEALHLE